MQYNNPELQENTSIIKYKTPLQKMVYNTKRSPLFLIVMHNITERTLERDCTNLYFSLLCKIKSITGNLLLSSNVVINLSESSFTVNCRDKEQLLGSPTNCAIVPIHVLISNIEDIIEHVKKMVGTYILPDSIEIYRMLNKTVPPTRSRVKFFYLSQYKNKRVDFKKFIF
jgi:hypothetical protein